MEQQFGRSTVFDLNYVGNRGYHEPNVNSGVNAFGAPAGFGPCRWHGTRRTRPSHQAPEVYSNANSNYQGLTASVIHRSKSLLLQFNYSWSHALDEISNGGILGFNAGHSQSLQLTPTICSTTTAMRTMMFGRISPAATSIRFLTGVGPTLSLMAGRSRAPSSTTRGFPFTVTMRQ